MARLQATSSQVATSQVRGQWVKPRPRHRNANYWHWIHKEDPTTYCGLPKSLDPVASEAVWNPLIRCCQKCMTRIAREGY